jgi:hypothetical protein
LGSSLAPSLQPTLRRSTPITITALLPFTVRLNTEGRMDVRLVADTLG